MNQTRVYVIHFKGWDEIRLDGDCALLRYCMSDHNKANLAPIQVVSVPQTDLCPADDRGPQTETMGRVSLPASAGVCVSWAANLKGLSGQGSVGWPSEVSLSLYMQPNAPAAAGPFQNRDEVTGGSRGEWKGPNTRQGTRAACLSHACVCPCHRRGPLPVLQGISKGIKPAWETISSDFTWMMSQ